MPKGVKMRKGFTLLEIIIAIIILSIGILAASQMTIMGMRVNTIVNNRMYARVVMARLFDSLTALPVTANAFFDTDGSPNLNIFDSTADHSMIIDNNVAGYRYTARWNVADTVPEPGIKTVRIHILWGTNNQNRISTDLLKRM